ncbi:MAG TPA: ABC transporter substrate-binding protein [Solirubrobacteraceae bacterium]|jgi:polar amino acid transport system substrate-binding protein|nr:ABC transporter substrate-binding protein [Solirubrobacteraceae bacterium]
MPKKFLFATAVPMLAASVAIAAGGPTAAAAKSASTAASSCSTSKLALHTAGQLTVATDDPAYPPYFEGNKPANGRGFESAVAYAVAKQLGFGTSKVKWVTEAFDSSYAPGPKSFDFDINEISITKARSQAVTFSTPYYTNPQAIIVYKNSALAHAKSLAAFKKASIGVQIGTTSLSAVDQVIKPNSQPSVFNTSNDVVEAFKIHRVDAIVVDYATALYLSSSEIKGSTIAGQFTAPGGDNWGLLMKKGSALAPCVDKALAKLRASGTLTKLTKRWMSSKVAVPVLK